MDRYSEIDQRLKNHKEKMDLPLNHLKYLSKADNRLSCFSIKGCGLFYDFSRQRVDSEIIKNLTDLAVQSGLREKFSSMRRGGKLNRTEKRAALHTTMRSNKPLLADDGVLSEIKSVKDEIKVFSEDFRSGKIKGTTGKPIDSIVVVGIGGSLLGTKFVFSALSGLVEKVIDTRFLGGVDIDNLSNILDETDPEKTLWIIISKSFTTVETLSNFNRIDHFLKEKGLLSSDHIVTVSNNPKAEENTLKSFPMLESVGGRYSVTSVVGGLPLSIGLGFDIYSEFLKGASSMDDHAENANEYENLPLVSALISHWNNQYLDYNTVGVIPYSAKLKEIIPHLMQLSMESNGKSVDTEGNKLTARSGTILFGDQGTDAQHSFFQLAHQGQPFPVEFIGVVKPYYEEEHLYRGVTTHQELWANMISQAKALAEGKESDDSYRNFDGNRPSSIILIDSVTPLNIGKLLSFFEAKTVFEAFLLNTNPFDQFGVELGKTNANSIRASIADRNEGKNAEKSDDITEFYLDTLFSGKI